MPSGTADHPIAVYGAKDASIYTVVAEDSAALAGVVVAGLGIFLGHVLHTPVCLRSQQSHAYQYPKRSGVNSHESTNHISTSANSE
jgi:hypothetical protein